MKSGIVKLPSGSYNPQPTVFSNCLLKLNIYQNLVICLPTPTDLPKTKNRVVEFLNFLCEFVFLLTLFVCLSVCLIDYSQTN